MIKNCELSFANLRKKFKIYIAQLKKYLSASKFTIATKYEVNCKYIYYDKIKNIYKNDKTI